MSRKSQNAAAVSLTIRDWIDQLIAVSENDFSVSRIDEFVSLHRICPDSLAPYTFYEGRYTRNLIYESDFCEVLAICWDIGQQSLPHDHAGGHCWMVTPIGRLRVQNYRVDARDPAKRACKLTATSEFDMDATHPARVENDEPVHQVLNLAEFGVRATSEHIYSPPYASCEVYDAEKDVLAVRRLVTGASTAGFAVASGRPRSEESPMVIGANREIRGRESRVGLVESRAAALVDAGTAFLSRATREREAPSCGKSKS